MFAKVKNKVDFIISLVLLFTTFMIGTSISSLAQNSKAAGSRYADLDAGPESIISESTPEEPELTLCVPPRYAENHISAVMTSSQNTSYPDITLPGIMVSQAPAEVTPVRSTEEYTESVYALKMITDKKDKSSSATHCTLVSLPGQLEHGASMPQKNYLPRCDEKSGITFTQNPERVIRPLESETCIIRGANVQPQDTQREYSIIHVSLSGTSETIHSAVTSAPNYMMKQKPAPASVTALPAGNSTQNVLHSDQKPFIPHKVIPPVNLSAGVPLPMQMNTPTDMPENPYTYHSVPASTMTPYYNRTGTQGNALTTSGVSNTGRNISAQKPDTAYFPPCVAGTYTATLPPVTQTHGTTPLVTPRASSACTAASECSPSSCSVACRPKKACSVQKTSPQHTCMTCQTEKKDFRIMRTPYVMKVSSAACRGGRTAVCESHCVPRKSIYCAKRSECAASVKETCTLQNMVKCRFCSAKTSCTGDVFTCTSCGYRQSTPTLSVCRTNGGNSVVSCAALERRRREKKQQKSIPTTSASTPAPASASTPAPTSISTPAPASASAPAPASASTPAIKVLPPVSSELPSDVKDQEPRILPETPTVPHALPEEIPGELPETIYPVSPVTLPNIRSEKSSVQNPVASQKNTEFQLNPNITTEKMVQTRERATFHLQPRLLPAPPQNVRMGQTSSAESSLSSINRKPEVCLVGYENMSHMTQPWEQASISPAIGIQAKAPTHSEVKRNFPDSDDTLTPSYQVSGQVPEPVPNGWNPPATGRPWPEDEYIIQGSDHGARAVEDENQLVQGLDAQDTVIRYSSPKGDVTLKASNPTYIYAPRFRSVRHVTGMKGFGQAVSTLRVHTPTRLEMQELSLGANAGTQNISTHDEVGKEQITQYDGKMFGGEVSRKLGISLSQQEATKAQEANLALGPGMIDAAAKPWNAEGVLRAITWSGNEEVRVFIDGERAAASIAVQNAPAIYIVKEADGEPQLQIYKVASSSSAKSGEEVVFTIYIENSGTIPVRNITIMDSLSGRLEMIKDSAESSLDVNLSYQLNEAGSLILRCNIINPIQPGEKGILRFKCLVR